LQPFIFAITLSKRIATQVNLFITALMQALSRDSY